MFALGCLVCFICIAFVGGLCVCILGLFGCYCWFVCVVGVTVYVVCGLATIFLCSPLLVWASFDCCGLFVWLLFARFVFAALWLGYFVTTCCLFCVRWVRF